MKNKKMVYNGYDEKYSTGAALKEIFEGEYLTTGRHHSVVLGISISDYLEMLDIKDEEEYRIFVNSSFCKIMKKNTDGEIVFFGHTVLDNVKISIVPNEININKKCTECGGKMEFKTGKYGPFLGCKDYPDCKHTQKIPIIGNLKTPFKVGD